MSSPKPKPNWAGRFVLAGMIIGTSFSFIFVRVPHWLRPQVLAEALNGIFAISFLFGGGYLGEWSYKNYGCKYGLHTWETYRLPTMKKCINCGRSLRPNYDQSNNVTQWEEGEYVRDPASGQIMWQKL